MPSSLQYFHLHSKVIFSPHSHLSSQLGYGYRQQQTAGVVSHLQISCVCNLWGPVQNNMQGLSFKHHYEFQVTADH